MLAPCGRVVSDLAPEKVKGLARGADLQYECGMVANETLLRALSRTLDGTRADKLGLPASWAFYEGKVRDNFTPGDGTRILITTDRLSAFDRVLTTLPFKGQVLNRLAAYWFPIRARAGIGL